MSYYITVMWMLPSMYTLMELQTTYVSECFMTHITYYITRFVFFIKFHLALQM